MSRASNIEATHLSHLRGTLAATQLAKSQTILLHGTPPALPPYRGDLGIDRRCAVRYMMFLWDMQSKLQKLHGELADNTQRQLPTPALKPRQFKNTTQA